VAAVLARLLFGVLGMAKPSLSTAAFLFLLMVVVGLAGDVAGRDEAELSRAERRVDMVNDFAVILRDPRELDDEMCFVRSCLKDRAVFPIRAVFIIWGC